MADFRKMLYAFALVALLVGITVPASAQISLMTCTGTANNPLIRGEDYTAMTGDIFITCTGGVPTAVGAAVPKVDITVFTTSTTITSKITDASVTPNFNEALLVVDEAGSVGPTTAPILNCGNSAAPYATTSTGTVFTCDITGTGTGAQTYCGPTNNTVLGTGVVCPANGIALGGGRPNVFQARQVSTSAGTAIQFLGVPLDPGASNGIFPGQRILRITNVRVNAVALGISGTGAFTNAFITTTVNFNGTNFGGSQVISVVNGTVRGGLVVSKSSISNPANFLQCTANNGNAKNAITLTEGFSTAFKVRNWRQIQLNGVPPPSTGGDWIFNFTGNYNGADVVQNVPNALYNTESGLMFPPGVPLPNFGNPPPGTGPSGAAPAGSIPFSNSTGGIAAAGTVTQGTRLAVRFSTAPAGSNPSVPNFVPLTSGGQTTGVMALVLGADANGAGGLPGTTTTGGSTTTIASLPAGIAVYEVLFSNPSAIETASIVVTVAPTVNLTATPATPDIAALTATGSFAPFYAAGIGANLATQINTTFTTSTSSSGSVTNFFPIPRFLDTVQGPVAVYDYSKCACDLLFPWVVGDATFTTSIVVANTSLDPCNGALLVAGGTCATGFTAAPQSGKVTFWYFGTTGISLDPTTPISTQASQSSTVAVPPGSYLAHIVSPSAAGTTPANGLSKLAGNFAGYVIAQAQFQYCHGVASISASSQPGFGTQTYIGLTLDKGSPLFRTVQTSNDGLVH